MPKQNRKERITEMKRQQILDASLITFSQKGYDRATTAEIAKTAGIAEGTIYNYFKSKRDVLLSLVKRYLAVDNVAGHLEQTEKTTDTELCTSAIQDRIDIAFNNINGLFLLLPEIQRDPESRKMYFEQIIKPIYIATKKFLESGQASDDLRPFNSDAVVRIILAIIIGLTVIYKIEGQEGLLRKLSHQELAVEVTNLILEGIKRK